MGDDTERIAIPIGKDLYLWVWQRVWVEGGECHVLRYRYTIQSNETDRRSAILRWQFHREKPNKDFGYLHSHVHVHATTGEGLDLTPLHIPTDRISLEMVIWHLFTDWAQFGVEPIKPDDKGWQDVLIDSEKTFRKARTHKGLPMEALATEKERAEDTPKPKKRRGFGRGRRK